MRPVSSSDSELLERWRRGDRDAGNELFERHFDAIYRFFVHKVPDDATDLVQRTFLACVEGRERFRAASSFRTYLFAIARHELFAHWRKRRPAADPAVSSVLDLSASPSTALALRAEHRLLLEALRSIPLELQIAIELHYWEELSAREIAEILELPEGTAKSRIRRAREALLERLAELEAEPGRFETTQLSLEAWAASLKDALLSEAKPSSD